MMRIGYLLFTFLLISISIKAQDAKEIVAAADRKMKGTSSYSEMKVRIVRPTYTRELGICAWTLGDDKLLIRITGPAKDKGTAFLRNGKEVWNWIPSIERTIKLPPSMMSQSWMGSDFTNDDLVKEGSLVKDYDHSLAGSEKISGMDCYKITMIPKEEAAVIWGSVKLWIEKDELIILKAEYFDEDGILVNTMLGSEVRYMGGRMLPTHMEIFPADQPGNKTELIYQDIRFDIGLKEEFFSAQRLRQQ